MDWKKEIAPKIQKGLQELKEQNLNPKEKKLKCDEIQKLLAENETEFSSYKGADKLSCTNQNIDSFDPDEWSALHNEFQRLCESKNESSS